jgi:transcriptional regulator with XRE-family HTH domain
MRQKMTTSVDRYVGERIYSLRLAHGLSRAQLSKLIGVTHQQVEKYEKGRNRIYVSRLLLIAKALSKDISYFVEGLESDDNKPVVTQHQRMCIEVSRNFMRIENPDHQAAVNTLIKSLANKSTVDADKET